MSLGADLGRETAIANPVQVELDATQASFDSLTLPDGAYRRRLTPEDAQDYVDFDELASFTHNSDTPDDHLPARFEVDDIEASIREGQVFEGIFDADDNFIAAMWLDHQTRPDVLEVANLIVHPHHRDARIGRHFLRSADTIAQVHGIEIQELHVDPLNSRGMYLYFDNGYLVEGYETEDDKYALKNWLIMTKRLGGVALDARPETERVVVTGDERGLEAAVADGLVGHAFRRHPASRDPHEHLVVFAPRSENQD
jgi:GNAT superfamily N-acetyltransferase